MDRLKGRQEVGWRPRPRSRKSMPNLRMLSQYNIEMSNGFKHLMWLTLVAVH